MMMQCFIFPINQIVIIPYDNFLEEVIKSKLVSYHFNKFL